MKSPDYDPETGYPLTGPDELESAWWQEHVVANGYPRPRLPRVHPAQMTIHDSIDYPHLVIEPRPDGWYVNGKRLRTG